MDLRTVVTDDFFKQLFSNEISQVLGYEDESVEIFFKDKTNLQLSPCGANFKYTRSQNGYIPFLGRKQYEISQRCIFSTSETRHKVVMGLKIRNSISSRSYVVSELTSDMQLDIVRGYKKLLEFEWPVTGEAVKINTDGSAVLTCINNYAALLLHPGHHMVEARYYNLLPNFIENAGIDELDTDKSVCHMYVLQRRVFPASLCPLEWKYPLNLIFKALSGRDIPCSDVVKNVVKIPHSLPIKCPNQFHHKWRSIEAPVSDPDMLKYQKEIPEFADSSIKFLWCEGNAYWIRRDSCFSQIETWLSDGNVFKSHPKNERYFIHLQKKKSNLNCQFDEQIMSSAFLPHDHALKTVMLRCIRMTYYKSQHIVSHKDKKPCWMSPSSQILALANSDEHRVPDIQAGVRIPDVGVFSAVADSIEISFNDGAMLHMNITVVDPTAGSLKLLCGQCRIVLSDGNYCVLEDMSSPPSYVLKYVSHVAAWIKWLALPNIEKIKRPFYSGTIYDRNEVKCIEMELEKIQKATKSDDSNINFKYLELSGDTCTPSYTTECVSFVDVTNALINTSKTLCDIDALIYSYKE